MKPRILRYNKWYVCGLISCWQCVGAGQRGLGETIAEAYECWRLKRDAPA
jgi:hypothetical protein